MGRALIDNSKKNAADLSIRRHSIRLPDIERRFTMRFMVIVKADKRSEAGVLPSRQDLEAMGKFNEELVKAGVLVDAAGLRPSSNGTRVSFGGGKPQVTDGPFA